MDCSSITELMLSERCGIVERRSCSHPTTPARLSICPKARSCNKLRRHHPHRFFEKMSARFPQGLLQIQSRQLLCNIKQDNGLTGRCKIRHDAPSNVSGFQDSQGQGAESFEFMPFGVEYKHGRLLPRALRSAYAFGSGAERRDGR